MKAVVTLIALALTACTTLPPADAGTTAGLGQVAVVNGLRIRPIEAIEDSRCPALDFELGVAQAVDQYRVTLITAEPQKAAPGEIDPRAYRFTFAVSFADQAATEAE